MWFDNLPFFATGFDNAQKLYNAQKPVLEKKLQGRGLKLLYSVPWPGQGIYTKNPLKSVDDLKGTKFRTYSPQTARPTPARCSSRHTRSTPRWRRRCRRRPSG